jgi:hypothetical protein
MDDRRDFVERNGPFLLTCIGLLGTCVVGLTAYFLRSRCTRVACCGMSCERDVLPPELAVQATGRV